ncbi:MAG: branched-chain amino acid ABC transporter permease [Xenococcaceae cyanobacterium MO_188.B29]|nr:branched-chain amino acid ABC transporter permease [Xenococcaceae cyanobacterium MO_188.B29]
MTQLLQTLINGLLLGGFYAVMVLGFSVFWGVMGVINLAHGEFLMTGAYLAWLLFTSFSIDPFASLLLIMPIMFIVGFIMQKFLLNRLLERPSLATLLATFGISVILANIHKIIYSADPRNVPVSYSGSFELLGLSLPLVKSLIFVVALAIMLGLYLFLQYTRLGKAIRAAAQNKNAAKIVGIDIEQVYAITAGICIALTAAAGAIISPTQAIFPFMGQPFTLKAFTITVLGGLGQIPGALLGGMLLGMAEVMVATYVPGIGTNLGVVISLLVLILVLIFRPQGILTGLKRMPID